MTASATDLKDVQAVLDRTIANFNRHDFKAYFKDFVEDYSAFPYVVSPLRHDATMWRAFIEGTGELDYVNYHQQDAVINIYNGTTAVVTGYYTFTWKPKGGDVNYQSGRASMVLAKLSGKWKIAHMHFSKMF